MVRIHQAAGRRHDAVAVRIGVVGKRNVELVAHLDQTRHRERRGTIHPDLAVPVGGHEAEGRIDRGVDDISIDPVALDDRLPVMHGRATQGIDADLHAGRFHQRQIDDVAEVGDIRREVVVQMGRLGLSRALVRHPRHAP